MASAPNEDAAKTIGQDKQYPDAIDQCKAQEGVHDETVNYGGKATGAQAPLPNTPSPFRLTGG